MYKPSGIPTEELLRMRKKALKLTTKGIEAQEIVRKDIVIDNVENRTAARAGK